MATVASVTRSERTGVVRNRRNGSRSSVSMKAIIMMTTNGATGTSSTRSLTATIRTSRRTPAANTESRPCPPYFTLETVLPIIPQPRCGRTGWPRHWPNRGDAPSCRTECPSDHRRLWSSGFPIDRPWRWPAQAGTGATPGLAPAAPRATCPDRPHRMGTPKAEHSAVKTTTQSNGAGGLSAQSEREVDDRQPGRVTAPPAWRICGSWRQK